MIEPASFAQGPSSPIVAAVLWLQGALLGTAATSIAVICVAGVGYQFLMGRIAARRAMTVIVGCFILFGAPSIAAALRALVAPEGSELAEHEPDASPLVAPRQLPLRPAPDPFNPYGSN